MSPSNVVPDPNLEEEPVVRLEAGASLDTSAFERAVVEEPQAAGEEEEEELDDDEDDEDEDEDEDELDDEEDEDEDDDEEDEDDEVGTDERGKETLRAPGAPTRPDVDSDRIVPATDAEPEGSLDRVKSKPLGIQQIEDLEDDAKGG